MNKTTKQLFNAPWSIEEEAPLAWYCVIDSNDSVVANDVRDQKTVNRLARLPELYDKLMWAVVQYCPDAFLTLDECRLCPDKKCKYREIIKLLRKVRNGE